MKVINSHKEKIKCPNCNSVQTGVVEHTHIFDVFIHNCSCGYIITESEWELQ